MNVIELDDNQIIINNDDVIETFSDTKKLDSYIAIVKESVKGNADLSTAASRKEIGSRAYKVSRIKTQLSEIAKQSVAEQKKTIAKVSSGKNYLELQLDKLRDETRKPLTDWEEEQKEIERKRVADIKARINNIRSMAVIGADATKEDIADIIQGLAGIDCSVGFDEFTQDAMKALNDTRDSLTKELMSITQKEALAEQQAQLDAEKAEFERQKAEFEARQKGLQLQEKAKTGAKQAIKTYQENQKESQLNQKAIEDTLYFLNKLRDMLFAWASYLPDSSDKKQKIMSIYNAINNSGLI